MNIDMAEIALAHFIGSEVERAYQRSDMLERRRAMMADWAGFLRGEVMADNVVKLGGVMKGPTLRLPSGRDWGASIKPQVLPEEMIAAFTGEILDAIPLAEIESHEDT
jgi:hypothetical protein